METGEIKEVANELVGLEGNKIFRTVKGLTTKPGQVIKEYCDGEKLKYLSPVFYFSGVSGIAYYLQSLSTEEYIKAAVEQWKRIFSSEFGILLSSAKVDNVISYVFNHTVQNIISLPITLFITWFVFRKQNASFRNSSWFALYTGAHSTLILTPSLLLFRLHNHFILTIVNFTSALLMLSYTVWTAMQFYQIKVGKAILLILLRFIIVFIFTYFILGLLIFMIYSYS